MTDSPQESAQAIAATLAWLDEVVIAERFCPYAASPRREGRVRVVTAPQAPDSLIPALQSELDYLVATPACETTLIVLLTPTEEKAIDFYAFLRLFDQAQEACHSAYGDEFSLAAFHPSYLFAGYATSDPVHYIHRSPYPTLHLLRESSLDEVRASTDGDTSRITSRNLDHVKLLGKAFFQQRS